MAFNQKDKLMGKKQEKKKSNRLNIITSEEYVKEHFENFTWNNTHLRDVREWVLKLQYELREELKKAQEENEKLKTGGVYRDLIEDNKDFYDQHLEGVKKQNKSQFRLADARDEIVKLKGELQDKSALIKQLQEQLNNPNTDNEKH
jgi:hypothetical protein